MTAIPRHAALLASEACRAFTADPGLPLPDPVAIRRVGSQAPADFLQTGFLLAATLEQAAGLGADSAVLDIGCGWGRLALPLARRLGPDGCYLGMDTAAAAIAWCRERIAAIDPRFRFHHADIRSSYANPTGRIAPGSARLLPWAERFDVVVATSLFTHLLPDGARRYLQEAARLCRPGGVLFATFFLLDAGARRACDEGRSRHRFPQPLGPAWIADPAVPEDAVAYDPAFILAALDENGFDAEVRPGVWCDRGPEAAAPFDYQDVVIARRRGAVARDGTRCHALGAIERVSGGRLVGWAWDRAKGGSAPTLAVELDGATVGTIRPDRPHPGAPAAGPPPGVPSGFDWALPADLIGKGAQRLRVMVAPAGDGAESPLVLCDRRVVLRPDTPGDMLRAWRREAVARGVWRIERLEARADGRLDGIGWAVPPRGLPWRGGLFANGAPLPVQPIDRADPALANAFGASETALRPWFRFTVTPDPAASDPLWLTLGAAPDRPFDPPCGFPVDPRARVASDRLAIAAAVRRHAGRDPGTFASVFDWGLGFARLSPAGGAAPGSPLPPLPLPDAGCDLAFAIGVLETLDRAAEEAWAAELARIVAPGALLVASALGRGAWLTAGSPGRFLTWQRHGIVAAPATQRVASPRLARTPERVTAVWDRRFEVVEVSELALGDLCDLVVLRRRA